MLVSSSCPPEVEGSETAGNVPLERDGNNKEQHQRKNRVEKGHGVVHGWQYCMIPGREGGGASKRDERILKLTTRLKGRCVYLYSLEM